MFSCHNYFDNSIVDLALCFFCCFIFEVSIYYFFKTQGQLISYYSLIYNSLTQLVKLNPVEMNLQINCRAQWMLPIEVNPHYRLFSQEYAFPSQPVYVLIPSKKQNKSAESRGGNNVSENLKKCFNCILRNHLPKQHLIQFQESCILKNNLKSQKQIPIVYFLYLHKFVALGIISQETLQKLSQIFRNKIKLFIRNSQNKRQIESQRYKYHMKNIESFEKYLEMDFCLKDITSFEQFSNQLQKLYTRKKNEFVKAKERLRAIVEEDSYFSTLFYDLNERELPQFCQSLSLPASFKFDFF